MLWFLMNLLLFLSISQNHSVIKPLVAFYDIHGRKREVLFFNFVPETTKYKSSPLTLWAPPRRLACPWTRRPRRTRGTWRGRCRSRPARPPRLRAIGAGAQTRAGSRPCAAETIRGTTAAAAPCRPAAATARRSHASAETNSALMISANQHISSLICNNSNFPHLHQ
jgi:hypothetical protein